MLGVEVSRVHQIVDVSTNPPTIANVPYTADEEAAADLAAAVLPDLLPYQFKAILVLSGQETALEAFFNGLPTQQKVVAQAKLDYALSFQRHDPLLLAAQSALGLTDAQLDALWVQAAAL